MNGYFSNVLNAYKNHSKDIRSLSMRRFWDPISTQRTLGVAFINKYSPPKWLLEIQKQPSRSVLRKRCSENMQHMYRRTPMSNCDFNIVALQLYWNHTSEWLFSCKFAACFQNTFSKNIYGGVVLEIGAGQYYDWFWSWKSYKSKTFWKLFYEWSFLHKGKRRRLILWRYSFTWKKWECRFRDAPNHR